MKKNYLFCLIFLTCTFIAESQEVKRYLTVEHFTNTVCSICASKNPGFFAKLDQYPNDVHHIAFHPPVPYSTCQLYQANPNDNATRANYYGVNGTPKVWLNGVSTGSQLITDDQINEALTQTSPIGIEVNETLGDSRNVTVNIKSFAEVPTGNYKLYVAIVEKVLNYSSPNGETVHHNVFRDYLAAGTDFSPAAAGETVSRTFDYTLDSEWVADEIYVYAFVQNNDTKEVLNSGTRFDPALPTSNRDLKESSLRMEVTPNPASDLLSIRFDEKINAAAQLKLQDATGRVVWSSAEVLTEQTVSVLGFAPGVYFLSLQNGKSRQVKKVVIQ